MVRPCHEYSGGEKAGLWAANTTLVLSSAAIVAGGILLRHTEGWKPYLIMGGGLAGCLFSAIALKSITGEHPDPTIWDPPDPFDDPWNDPLPPRQLEPDPLEGYRWNAREHRYEPIDPHPHPDIPGYTWSEELGHYVRIEDPPNLEPNPQQFGTQSVATLPSEFRDWANSTKKHCNHANTNMLLVGAIPPQMRVILPTWTIEDARFLARSWERKASKRCPYTQQELPTSVITRVEQQAGDRRAPTVGDSQYVENSLAYLQRVATLHLLASEPPTKVGEWLRNMPADEAAFFGALPVQVGTRWVTLKQCANEAQGPAFTAAIEALHVRLSPCDGYLELLDDFRQFIETDEQTLASWLEGKDEVFEDLPILIDAETKTLFDIQSQDAGQPLADVLRGLYDALCPKLTL